MGNVNPDSPIDVATDCTAEELLVGSRQRQDCLSSGALFLASCPVGTEGLSLPGKATSP
jgi:hypothetical protein